MPKFIVIGGAGLLGSYIVEQLAGKYGIDQVAVLDLKKPKLPVTFYEKNLLADSLQMLQDFDVIIHCASPPHGLKNKQVYYQVNVDGTRNILQASHGKKIVYTSSASVVFDGSHLLNAGEDHPYSKTHIDEYNFSKEQGERLVLKANGVDNTMTCALRPAGIFGPGDMQASYSIYQAAKRNNHKFIIGNNNNLFDFTYVENCAWAHVLAAEKLLEEDVNVAGKVFNITNDEPIFFFDFAKAIYEGIDARPSLMYTIPVPLAFALAYIAEFFLMIMQMFVSKEIELSFTVFRLRFLTRNRVYNIDNAKTHLQYKPKYSMEQGLEKTIKWLKTIE